jgi:flavin-dependent dehydrogenase
VRAFDCEVAIVGAGPAGSTLALSLVEERPELSGRILVLDRARFPREKPCAGALGARGDTLLRSIGAEIDVPSAWVDGIAFRGSEQESVASPGRIGRVVRRVEFDHALLGLVKARGIEVREGVRVRGVRDKGDAGVELDTEQGPLLARSVAGCDGVGSVVRKALGLGPGRLRAQVVEVDTEAVASDGDRSLLTFDARDRALPGYAWDFPTVVAGRALVCRGVYRLKIDGESAEGTADVGALLDARLRAQGLDPSRCTHKRYAERGFEPSACVARGAVVLAGEAAGIDPVTGEGIAQAIEYGVLLGRFLARRLDGSGEGAVDLSGWGRALGASRLARDLRIRTRFVELFYGPARPAVESFLTETPDALHVGGQHFAAQPYDWMRLLEVLGRGAAALAGVRIAEALAV